MQTIKICSIIFSLLISSSYSQENDLEKNVRTVVNLLDYIGTDYNNAVDNGKIINKEEYSEIVDFAERSQLAFINISTSLKTINPVINNELKELSQLIKNRADNNLIFAKANEIKIINS